MPRDHKSDLPTVDQVILSAKTSVFFIDDKQNVRHQEQCSSAGIKVAAARAKASIEEVELLSQFRCMGSDNFVTWIESVLGLDDSDIMYRENDNFDFRIFDSPSELYKSLEEK